MPQLRRSEQQALDDARKAARQRALHLLPDLHVRVYAEPEGVRVAARLESLREGGYRGVEWIADVTFSPREVTEELVVQWAIGALSTWLQGKAEAAAEAVHNEA
jgi:uncharacterized protein with von Willebrand factor type A (vWA) domain